MALTAEQVIIVGRGRLIADVSVAEITRNGSLEEAFMALTPERR